MDALMIASTIIGGVIGILGIGGMIASYGIWRGKLEGRLNAHIDEDASNFKRIETRQSSAAVERGEIKGMVSESNQRLARIEGRLNGGNW